MSNWKAVLIILIIVLFGHNDVYESRQRYKARSENDFSGSSLESKGKDCL